MPAWTEDQVNLDGTVEDEHVVRDLAQAVPECSHCVEVFAYLRECGLRRREVAWIATNADVDPRTLPAQSLSGYLLPCVSLNSTGHCSQDASKADPHTSLSLP